MPSVSHKKIIVTGGAGFIGKKLTKRLLEKEYSVIVVDFFDPKITHPNLTFLKLDLSLDFLPQSYDGEIFGIIHLAGKNIFGRWTDTFKQALWNSRIKSTKNIVSSISSWQTKPHVFVSASAFGYYGNKKELEITEDSLPGDDFLSELCLNWEKEAHAIESFKVRSVQIRTAHVLGPGGLLAPLFVPFRFGLGAWIGGGHAWLPWIHIDDIVSVYVHALESDVLFGPINAVAHEQVRQKYFMKKFGALFHRKVLFSIPIFVLRLFYLDLALTFNNSVKMSPKKLTESGFVHTYPDLKSAFYNIPRT